MEGSMDAKSPKELAAAFGRAVTAHSTVSSDFVAKSGNLSLYNAFRHIVPQACLQDDTAFRLKGKISAPSFNKVMASQCGFTSGRTRKMSVTSVAGNWIFIDRRWLNPQNEDDYLMLDRSYDDMRTGFPTFEMCSKAHFMEILSMMCSPWNEMSDDASGSHMPTFECASGAPQDHLDLWNQIGRGGATQNSLNVLPWTIVTDPYDPTGGIPYAAFLSSPMIGLRYGDNDAFLCGQSERTRLNVGQKLDLTLHKYWTLGKTMPIDPDDLVRFATTDDL